MIFEGEGEEKEGGDEGAEEIGEIREIEEIEDKEVTYDSERAETEAEGSSHSFLTKRQLEVLQMRHQGLSQQDVADRLGTTRSNISILEKRAHQNIDRAERTVRQWMMIRAPITLEAAAGTDVFNLPKMIFAAADKRGIRLPVTSLDIVVQLRRTAPGLFKKRALGKDARIYVNENGEVMVEEVEVCEA